MKGSLVRYHPIVHLRDFTEGLGFGFPLTPLQQRQFPPASPCGHDLIAESPTVILT